MSVPPALRSFFVSTIGSWVIGATVSTGLLGIATLQSWVYYTRFPRDPPLLKLFVVLIWSLEATRTIICVYGGYHYSVELWGDVSATVGPTHWSLPAMVLFTAPIELLAHSFFAHQVRCVTTGKYRLLFYFIVILSITSFGFGIASYALAVRADFRKIVFGLPSHIANGALASSIVVDWTITIWLVSFLRKNQTARIRSLMQTLMLYAVNFGLLISLTDVVVLIVTNTRWHNVNLYQVSVFEVIGNFYANTVLASLNSRTLVAEHLYQPGNIHFSSINAASTQIHGFNHPNPGISSASEAVYHITTVGNDDVSQDTSRDSIGVPRVHGDEGIRRSVEDIEKESGIMVKFERVLV